MSWWRGSGRLRWGLPCTCVASACVAVYLTEDARLLSAQTPASFIPHGYEFGVPAVLTNASAFVRDIMGEAGAHQASAEEPPLFLYSRHGSKFGAVDGDVEVRNRCKPGLVPLCCWS